MSVVAARIVVAVSIPSPVLSAELLTIAPSHVGCANIYYPPTRFVFCVFRAALILLDLMSHSILVPGGPSPMSRGVLQHLCPP